MKINVMIFDASNTVLFKGNPINLPVKEDDIKRVSIAMFRDENPCIIHQSYAVQHLIEGMLQHFGRTSQSRIPLSSHMEHVSFLKFDHLDQLYLSLEVKG